MDPIVDMAKVDVFVKIIELENVSIIRAAIPCNFQMTGHILQSKLISYENQEIQ